MNSSQLTECISHIYMWVNYNISLTWIKAIWGWFPLLTMIPGLGRSEVVIIIHWPRYTHIYVYMYIYIPYICIHIPCIYTHVYIYIYIHKIICQMTPMAYHQLPSSNSLELKRHSSGWRCRCCWPGRNVQPQRVAFWEELATFETVKYVKCWI